MENKELQFPDEWEHLTFIQTRLDQALGEAKESVSRLDRQYTMPDNICPMPGERSILMKCFKMSCF